MFNVRTLLASLAGITDPKRILPTLGLFLLLAPSTTFGQGDPTPVVLQLRWHHQFQFAGYYMAKHLGYYDQVGLDVEIRPGGKDISPIEEVVSGRADFSIDGSGLLIEHARGTPIVAVAALFQRSPLRLLAKAGHGIERIQDLRNRRVMLLPQYRSLALIAMLQQVALLEDIVRVDSSADIQDLLLDRVDAFNAYNSNEPYVLENAGIDTVAFSPSDYGINFYSDVVFTRLSRHGDKGGLTKRFWDASRRGWIYALDHPEQAIDLIRRHYNPEKSSSHLRFEANAVRASIIPDMVEIGHMSETRWERIREQLAAMGLVPHDLDLGTFLHHERTQESADWEELQRYALSVTLVLAALLAIATLVMRKNIQLKDEVNERMQAENRSYYLATHDQLTGLPNRMLLIERLECCLARSRRRQQMPLLAFLDLDNFKALNDHDGHQAGDRLLVDIGSRVSRVIRSEDTFARMGGDEFVLLMEDIDPVDAGLRLERIMTQIRAASEAQESDVSVSASIGALIIDGAETASTDTVLKTADDLMYQVKNSTKNDYLTCRLSAATAPQEPPDHPVQVNQCRRV
jgi:diguanylate cyclase (GGDEF)-like protein